MAPSSAKPRRDFRDPTSSDSGAPASCNGRPELLYCDAFLFQGSHDTRGSASPDSGAKLLRVYGGHNDICSFTPTPLSFSKDLPRKREKGGAFV